MDERSGCATRLCAPIQPEASAPPSRVRRGRPGRGLRRCAFAVVLALAGCRGLDTTRSDSAWVIGYQPEGSASDILSFAASGTDPSRARLAITCCQVDDEPATLQLQFATANQERIAAPGTPVTVHLQVDDQPSHTFDAAGLFANAPFSGAIIVDSSAPVLGEIAAGEAAFVRIETPARSFFFEIALTSAGQAMGIPMTTCANRVRASAPRDQ